MGDGCGAVSQYGDGDVFSLGHTEIQCSVLCSTPVVASITVRGK